MRNFTKFINKTISAAIAAAIATAALVSVPISSYAANSHTETTPYNWYFKKNSEHKTPPLPSEFSFIKSHGGYFIDDNAKNSDKVIYLTFDAGYENGNVEKVLRALDKHGAKGAFFILDNLIIRNKELVQSMIYGGHTVANHTAKHPDMSAITDKNLFNKQLTKLETVYFDTFGAKISPYYRPPQGRFSEQNLKYAEELGYKTIFWSYAYADWDNNKQPSPAKAIEQIMCHTHNGMVILLHPTSATNAEIMDELLTKWESQGYRFGTLDELTK